LPFSGARDRQSLDTYWCHDKGIYVSRREVANPTPGKELDFATILAVIHAGRKEGAHSVSDPRVMASLARLEALFDASYEINQGARLTLARLGRYAVILISVAAPIIFRRSARRNSIIRSRERWRQARIFQ